MLDGHTTVHNGTVCVDFVKKDTFMLISVIENVPKNCFLFSFSPTKLLATSTRFTASVLSSWAWSIIRWFSLESSVVARKYVFTCFNTEKDCSLTAFVAGITSISFPRMQTLLKIILQELSRD